MANVEISALYRQVAALKAECERLRLRVVTTPSVAAVARANEERDHAALEMRARPPLLPRVAAPCSVCGAGGEHEQVRIQYANATLDAPVCGAACAIAHLADVVKGDFGACLKVLEGTALAPRSPDPVAPLPPAPIPIRNARRRR